MQRRQAIGTSAITVAALVGGVLGVGRANGLFGAHRPGRPTPALVASEAPVPATVPAPTTTEAPAPPTTVVHRTVRTSVPRRATTTTAATTPAEERAVPVEAVPPATTVTTVRPREDHDVLQPVERHHDDGEDD